MIFLAVALPAGVTLEWTAPAECPDRAYVHGEVARLLGDSAVKKRVDARAVVTRTGDTFRVRITTTAGAERTLDAPTCKAIGDATALIVAIAVDPTVASKPAP